MEPFGGGSPPPIAVLEVVPRKNPYVAGFNYKRELAMFYGMKVEPDSNFLWGIPLESQSASPQLFRTPASNLFMNHCRNLSVGVPYSSHHLYKEITV